MELAVMITKGEVQWVGYRDTVKKIARKLNVTGFVANPKSRDDVRIIVARWRGILEGFLTQVGVEKHPIAPISVKDMNVTSNQRPMQSQNL